jgi:hypothetical protein
MTLLSGSTGVKMAVVTPVVMLLAKPREERALDSSVYIGKPGLNLIDVT